MIKLAIYGKGGSGKSTTASNLAAVWASQGYTVMQIGCDPKADSTLLLRQGRELPTVLDSIRDKGAALTLDDIVLKAACGVLCVEAGGPTPGLGCAGRGIIAALETLTRLGYEQRFQPDILIYDVLGDVVCGGFSLPIRQGYADKVFIITSGENMALHAAANIALAVEQFKQRGYARLGGLILNRRNVPREQEKAEELAQDIHSAIIGELSFSQTVQQAEEQGQSVVEAFPDSEAAAQYRTLAGTVYAICRQKEG